GEAEALAAGFARAAGELVVALPAAATVEPADLHRLLEPVAAGEADLVMARRDRPGRAAWDRLQGAAFHWLVRKLTGVGLSDLSSGVAVMRRRVAVELRLYGDLHRFMPILAAGRGFRVGELVVRSRPGPRRPHLRAPGTYMRRLLDLLTVFFLLKFTRKPLRFFGLLGSLLAAAGGALLGYLGVERLAGVPLAERPLLLLAVLLLVLGVQAVGLGLLGELIIYTRRGDADGYAVDRVSD
ncbi:MAG TPA: glycosyltransferase, partial [Thermodesulfobacteriota bacterium]|nr:glycosyltransferase [Thermodesulfobacteriota bacterium]